MKPGSYQKNNTYKMEKKNIRIDFRILLLILN